MPLYRLIHKAPVTVKNIIINILRFVGLFVIFIFIFISMLLPLNTEHSFIGGYKYTKYDLELYDCMDTFLEKPETAKHIDSVIKTGYFYGMGLRKSDSKDEYIRVEASSIDAESLKELFEIIPKSLFIDYDNSIIEKGNCVFISRGKAQSLKVKVGDSVQLKRKDNIIKIAGIYEGVLNNMFLNHGDMLILDKENPYYAKPEYYQRVYVKLNDYASGIKYFNENYLKQGYLYEKYGDNWQENAAPKDITKAKKDAFTLRKVSLRMAQDEFNAAYNPYEISIKVFLSLLALFTTNIYTYYKHAQNSKRKFVILRIAGCPRYKIFIYYIAASFVEQVILVTAALLFIRYVPLKTSYISLALLLTWLKTYFMIILSSSVVSGIISLYNVRDNELLQSIQEEKV